MCARTDTGFKDVARLLAENDVTALPVVDEGDRPLGVVSEADLIRRQAGRPDTRGLLSALTPAREQRPDTRASTAGDLMHSPAVTARPEWNVVETARVMERHGIKRLPVVNDAGRLVGLVSRSDLLRVFLRQDSAIEDEISHDILDHMLGFAPRQVEVTVHDGRVTLKGTIDNGGLTPVIDQLCRGVDGVVDVHDDLVGRTGNA